MYHHPSGMKYRTSATHLGKYASKPFRSSDERFGVVLFDSKEEALRDENVKPFRDFVQVRCACEAVRSPEAVHRLSATRDGERLPDLSSHRAEQPCTLRLPR
jgi:hypothetical protein